MSRIVEGARVDTESERYVEFRRELVEFLRRAEVRYPAEYGLTAMLDLVGWALSRAEDDDALDAAKRILGTFHAYHRARGSS
jgi:hypothetical protein